ncbi:hypothetical protein BDV98DRAFT_635582 [Pterulicium gracile]|uniref:Uncharacterized protein n=1 Tax=Pterulicium gracile TaxID=1884261 RepID=A0A5C3Q697_9AGAR|nr:hypothetical protein BDV98DRAFT_635582 [Pterula gracilis]
MQPMQRQIVEKSKSQNEVCAVVVLPVDDELASAGLWSVCAPSLSAQFEAITTNSDQGSASRTRPPTDLDVQYPDHDYRGVVNPNSNPHPTQAPHISRSTPPESIAKTAPHDSNPNPQSGSEDHDQPASSITSSRSSLSRKSERLTYPCVYVYVC